ncbi:hypothetical protein SynROS8604_02741 [Synechococcus sp. ROS8604]|nr:hypothetical protein SynROS8604_02741 [Synechococcus sp. ROS8604]
MRRIRNSPILRNQPNRLQSQSPSRHPSISDVLAMLSSKLELQLVIQTHLAIQHSWIQGLDI